MKPSADTDILARCLALMPLTGWPEWETHPSRQHRLMKRDYKGEHPGLWGIEDYLPWSTWSLEQIVAPHIALCIWQDHLLRWLAGQGGNVTLSNLPSGGWVAMVGLCYTATCDTLPEALLDVCEQIQKEQSDA